VYFNGAPLLDVDDAKLTSGRAALLTHTSSAEFDNVVVSPTPATNLYARTLSDSQEELTATLSSGISVNHAVTVFYALLGGWIWDRFGPGFLFATAAFMALANSAFALTVPKPVKRSRSA
jgi:hypothetical protein